MAEPQECQAKQASWEKANTTQLFVQAYGEQSNSQHTGLLGLGWSCLAGTDFQFLEVKSSRGLLRNDVHRVNTTVPLKMTRMVNLMLRVFITFNKKEHFWC